MCTVFTKNKVLELLNGKSVLFLGDSIMRCIYKDIIYLTKHNSLIDYNPLKRKGEESFEGDRLLEVSNDDVSGRNYKEARDFYLDCNRTRYSFIFITRCFSKELKDGMVKYRDNYGEYPHVMIMNSALWDINRWGGKGIEMFKENIGKLVELLKNVLPKTTQVVWVTTPPISVDIRGGFLLQHLDFQRHSMRFNVMESNLYAANAFSAAGFDVLDMHYYFTRMVQRRAEDGIHWNPDAVRFQTCTLLTHICLAWKVDLGEMYELTENNNEDANILLKEAVDIAKAADDDYLPLVTENEASDWEKDPRIYKRAARRFPRNN